MNAIVTQDSARLPALQSGGSVKAIVPQDFDGAWRIALAVVKAGMAPPGLDTAEKAMVAIMHGMEVGLTPMAALQSIAVINGRPTIWGDGALALVRGSGMLEWIEEIDEGDVSICRAKRKGEPKPIERSFSDNDAQEAGLLGKAGPWKQYKKRMRQMRARSWTLRDGFADILRGLGIAEEVRDTNTDAQAPAAPPRPPMPPTDVIDVDTGEIIDERETVVETGEATDSVIDDQAETLGDYFTKLEDTLAGANTAAEIAEVWNDFDPLSRFEGDEDSQALATSIKRKHVQRVGQK